MTTPEHLSYDAGLERLVRTLTDTPDARVMLIGSSGTGKSTLAEAAAQALDAAGVALDVATLDPGRPMLGVPGAIALGQRRADGWEVVAQAGLATLDAARFRLPLVAASHALLQHARQGVALLIDAPGLTRGPQAAELMEGFVQALGVTHVLMLMQGRDADARALIEPLRALPVEAAIVEAHPLARKLSDGKRLSDRTGRWLAFIDHADATTERLSLDGLPVRGLPPRDAAEWPGLLVGLEGERGEPLGLGVVVDRAGVALDVRWRRWRAGTVRALVLRDARVTGEGDGRRLATTGKAKAEPATPALSKHGGAFTPRLRPDIPLHVSGPSVPGASIRVIAPGDLFDDPMFVLRLDHRQRCLFLDLGEVAKVPTRIVHQATDILMSHAHLDHLGDLPWLLRRRVGMSTPCRIYGPPGLSERVANLVHGFTWDRVELRGPSFEVGEYDEAAATLTWWHVQAGVEGRRQLRVDAVVDQTILHEPRLRVRATTLDHGIPVLAYAVEEPQTFSVRGNVLRAQGWRPDAWLGDLKWRAAAEQLDDLITVPHADGAASEHTVGALADVLLIPQPGQKIVYATDFADTPENRARLVPLASRAHIFICEASFTSADADQAARTGHLTATSCASIAREADVHTLVPFHHSVRYEDDPRQIYDELLATFDRVQVPEPLR